MRDGAIGERRASARGALNPEQRRLREAVEHRVHWRRWGPYLSEREWGTVREDYSADGAAWEYLPHDHARSRAYRWGEDGILGICDNHQRLCFALAMWNEQDPILKERLFGLTGHEGNHGEDVKESYFYLDGVPSHAYLKGLYRYPKRAFPYARLVEESRRRGKHDPEFELIDTGVFDDDEYFDVTVEYAKAAPTDILIAITVENRSATPGRLRLLPTLWFRNTWSWAPVPVKPSLRLDDDVRARRAVIADHPTLGEYVLYVADADAVPLFTENETNAERLFGAPNPSAYVKDGIDACVVHGRTDAVNPTLTGTKCAIEHRLRLAPGERTTVRLRLASPIPDRAPFDAVFGAIVDARRAEADAFHRELNPHPLSGDLRAVQRQAFAGMLWSKQFYNYVVRDWLDGDPLQPPPPPARLTGRNHTWIHLYNDDILAMPDTWEYPWFAAWDLAFHAIPLAVIDPDFAKRQLDLLTREWYMHPNGQLPAYEWAFDDVNPPVHAWAALRVYKIEEKRHGSGDRLFLERVFQKLLLNFTWWVNRKDAHGNNVFQGGFLGLDNVGVFDRSKPLPGGGHIDESDGTSWMGVYALNLLAIALELAKQNRAYEDIASKFFEHFLYIADAMGPADARHEGLWDDADQFFYDVLGLPDGREIPLKVRSIVGLIPLLAVETLEPEVVEALPNFAKRMEWFIHHRPDLRENVACVETPGVGERRLLAIVTPEKLRAVLRRMLDEAEFLSPHGIRSLSRHHAEHPYRLELDGSVYSVDYEPAESTSGLFGGNSNWRGPVWFPINYLLIEALQKFHHYLGDGFTVEFPTGSGRQLNLWEVATELSHRLIGIFARRMTDGRRPVFGDVERFQRDPKWCDLIPFHEYFNGETGAGLGASHQTGWTGLVAKLIQQCGEYCGEGRAPRASRASAPAARAAAAAVT